MVAMSSFPKLTTDAITKSWLEKRPEAEAMEATHTFLAKSDMAMYLRWDIWEILSLEEDII